MGGSLVAVRAAGSGGGRSTAALVELKLAGDLDPAGAVGSLVAVALALAVAARRGARRSVARQPNREAA